ncbi:MAG: DUF3489 domain-containing protein [Magnetococcales bacterium]|nr:DUF3489 domain-containing protein [Magnetococcales bacterium]
MSNLTETQQTIPEAAAKRANGSIHPLPGNVKGGAAKKVIKSMHQQGLIEEIETDVWRITKAGYAAIGKEAPQEIEEESDSTNTGGAETADNENNNQELEPNHEEMADNQDEPNIEEDAAYHAENAVACEESDGTDDYDNPPQSIFCPMDQADLPQAPIDAPADARDQDFEAIAKRHFKGYGLLDSDWPAIRNAIEEAYAMGFRDAKANTEPKTRTPRENSKKAIVMALLQRPEGATLQQIAEATDWTDNTIRGFLSLAKKKQGLNLETFRTRMHGTNLQGAKGSFTTYKLV